MPTGRNSHRGELAALIDQYLNRLNSIDGHSYATAAEQLDERQAILRYLEDRGYGHRHYRHYATRERVSSILGDHAIYLTDGTGWNDRYDRERFNSPSSPYKRFGTCFSFSSAESVAMWMLYGGRDGDGAMIDFDKTTLRDAMGQPDYELGHFDGSGTFVAMAALLSHDVSLSLRDVLYFTAEGDGYSLKRGGGREAKVHAPGMMLEGLSEIIKHSAWSYECEVRLIAEVDKGLLGESESSVSCIRVPLTFGEGFAAERVYESPISDGEGGYQKSALHGTVDWDLCKGCAAQMAVHDEG